MVYMAVVLRYRKETGTLTVLPFSEFILMADENIETALSPGHLLNEERVLRISPSSTSKNKHGQPTHGKIKVFNNIVRIATWNVQSLYMLGKLANVEVEMSRLNIDILGISEARWPGSGKLKTSKGHIYYSGGNDPKHQYGTAVLVTNDIDKAVTDFVPVCDRVMLLRIQTSYRFLNIIQVYAPTSDKSDVEIEEFYSNIEKVLSLTKKGEITLVVGDFNAKIGCGEEGECVGKYGLGIRNTRGDRLVQFCTENSFLVTNTFFKLHPRRLYTWKSPADKKDKIVRNQIDFILTNHQFRKYIKSVKTYPGADIDSDHNPLVMEFKMKRIKYIKGKKQTKRIDIEKLKDPLVRMQLGPKIEHQINELNTSEQTDVETTWKCVKDTIIHIQDTEIGFKQDEKKKEWMTTEILNLMEERRKYKNAPLQYKELNKIIRRKCRNAKEEWMSEKCREIELLQEKHDSFNIHKKVKEMTNKRKKQLVGTLRNADNEILLGIEDKLKRWKEYVEALFDDERPNTSPEVDHILNEVGPPITKTEVAHAIKSQKNGKATGPDNVYAEVVKVIAEQEGLGLDILTSMFNTIYTTGQIPSDWLKSTFVTLPKKSNASQCDDYRMISLMSHVLKIFLRIIHTRIYRKCDNQVDKTQFGFRNGFGTREALFSLNVLTQRCRDMNVNVFACFIDYRKAFDCVKHHKMIEILKETGVDQQEIKIISNLYWHQVAEVRVETATSDVVLIKRGVRQGCILSPLLFNIYSEAIFREALDTVNGGITVNGIKINNIRYADDTVIMADNMADLQSVVDCIVQHSEQSGLHINIDKTKMLVFSKGNVNANLLIKGNTVQQVSSFKYLGTLINDQIDPRKEIRSRIEQARRVFTQMKTFFTRSDLSLELRIRMIRCYIFSVLLYGCESWTLNPSLERNLEAFEMYLYRRVLRISWVQKVTNEEVLRRMGKQKELLLTIKQRKTRYIGHVMRGDRYEFLRLIIEGKIQGKRSIGRRQNSWLKDLRRWFGCSSIDIFRAAVSRTVLAIWIANLREETAT